MTTASPGTDIVGEELEALVPQCPHCDAVLNTIHIRRLDVVGDRTTIWGKRYVYACPSCNKLLAITHRKGFWMG